MDSMIARALAFLATPVDACLEVRLSKNRFSMLVTCENKGFKYVYPGVAEGWTNNISEVMTDYAAFAASIPVVMISLYNKSGRIVLYKADPTTIDPKCPSNLSEQAMALLTRQRSNPPM